MRPIQERPQFVPMIGSLVLHVTIILLALFIRIAEPYAAPEELLHFNVKSVDTRPLLLKYTAPATNPASQIHSRRFIRPAGEGSPKDVPVDALVRPETVIENFKGATLAVGDNTLRALFYFFSIKDTSDILVSWTINNISQKFQLQNQELISIQTNASYIGTEISAKVEAVNRSNQSENATGFLYLKVQ